MLPRLLTTLQQLQTRRAVMNNWFESSIVLDLAYSCQGMINELHAALLPSLFAGSCSHCFFDMHNVLTLFFIYQIAGRSISNRQSSRLQRTSLTLSLSCIHARALIMLVNRDVPSARRLLEPVDLKAFSHARRPRYMTPFPDHATWDMMHLDLDPRLTSKCGVDTANKTKSASSASGTNSPTTSH
jgi:hypothetical protein